MPRPTRGSRSSVIAPNLTPLLDIVLQLITFFMMLVHFGSRLEGANRSIRLPVAPAALPGSDLTIDRLPAALDARGRLLVGDEAFEGASASAWWATQAKTRRGGLEILGKAAQGSLAAADDELPTVVILRADRDASYGAVRRTLEEAQEQGFAHFSLVVLRRGKP